MTEEDYQKQFAQNIVTLHSCGVFPVIVHGGGPEISYNMKLDGLKAKFVDGLRVTDKASLKITEMVLSGSINKKFVSLIAHFGGTAVGVSGKDGNLIQVKKLKIKDVDLGFVGEIVSIDPKLIHSIIECGYIPVISPIGMDKKGETYNVNADTVASRIASALNAEKMVFVTDVPGILDNGKILVSLQASKIKGLINNNIITGGMIPKVEAIVYALNHGVKSANIIDGKGPQGVLELILSRQSIGTEILSAS